MNDFGVETHLGGGVMSAFVILLAAITRELASSSTTVMFAFIPMC